MLFRRKKRQVPPGSESGIDEEPQLYQIDFDMMLKGSVFKRRKGMVRQFGVTVNGSTKLVTSGDIVDRETYRALVAAGAIRPLGAREPGAKGAPAGLIDADSDEE